MELQPSPLARYLFSAYVVLVSYASLQPLASWRVQHHQPLAFLFAPWPRYVTAFDVASNVLAYVPLGALAVLALHPRARGIAAVIIATLLGAGLSIGLEAMQNYLPERIPSNLDVVTNICGAFFGALAGMIAAPRLLREGGLAGLRDRYFVPGKRADVGLLLIGLWLVTQLNPETLLFGNGDLRELLGATPSGAYPAQTFIRIEGVVAAANLLAVALLAGILIAGRSARMVVVLLIGAALLIRMTAFAVLFEPTEAFAWGTPGALAGLAIGLSLAMLALALPRGPAIALAGVLLMSATALVNVAPANPYLANSLALWRQGHFLNFNGVTRLLSLLWPFAALVYLMLGAARDEK
jgi:VanZ family protein